MEARRRPRAGKTRIPGQRVESFSICGSRADVARCFHWKMHFHGAGEMKETARLFLCFEHSFSISLSLSRLIPSFFVSSLARFSSSMVSRRAHAERTEVASRFFMARFSLRLARFPTITPLASFSARFNIISNRGRNCSP